MDRESLDKTCHLQLVGNKENNYDGENLKKRGFEAPLQCPLCLRNEEKLNHLLDECSFSSTHWDRGVTIFVEMIELEANRIKISKNGT